MKLNFVSKLVLYSITLVTISFKVGLHFNNTKTYIGSETVSSLEDKSFNFGGRRYVDITVNNFDITPDGEFLTFLSAQDETTKDTVTFASSANVAPAKWGQAKWGEAKWE